MRPRPSPPRGTMTPSAPESSARAKRGRSFASTRTSAAQRPAIACSAGISSASVPAPCSRSTSSQSNPARAQTSAETAEPRLRNVPTSVSPAARRSLVVGSAGARRGRARTPPRRVLHLRLRRDLGRRDVPPHAGVRQVAVRLGLADDHARRAARSRAALRARARSSSGGRRATSRAPRPSALRARSSCDVVALEPPVPSRRAELVAERAARRAPICSRRMHW